jgi:hypothetical protein
VADLSAWGTSRRRRRSAIGAWRVALGGGRVASRSLRSRTASQEHP